MTPPAGHPAELLAELTYVLALKHHRDDGGTSDDLNEYLRWLVRHVQVIVVDGSPPEVYRSHAWSWPPQVRQLPPNPQYVCPNGKVRGVLTGLAMVSTTKMIIADDDVRFEDRSLRRLAVLLDQSDLVIPQNVFSPLPWHARWDTGRILLNRAFGGDYPGSLGVRSAVMRRSRGYCGEALFENLELIRTVRAVGGTVVRADELIVVRRPPTAEKFASQRVRQAYDSLGQPTRLMIELALLPLLAGRTRWALLAATVAAAAIGRRRGGSSDSFPAATVVWAPIWLVERAVCAWLAVAARLACGGVRYRGRRVRVAAHSLRELRRWSATASPTTEFRCEIRMSCACRRTTA